MLNTFVINRCMVLMRKWDAGRGAAADRAGEDHLFRRRADDEPRADAASRPRQIRPLDADRHRRRRRRRARPTTSRGLRETFKTAQPALGYGLTETNAVGCGNVWSNYAAKPDSTGRPHRADGRPGDPRRRRPPARRRRARRGRDPIGRQHQGYWRDPAATAAAFTADGYFRTGDIGYLDEDDYLFIVDRKKDIIIRGGENIACPEVEAALYAHEAVAEASVFGVPDERLGEVPVAVVHLEEGGMLTARTICARRSPAGSAPFKVPAADRHLARAAAQARHRQDRQGEPARPLPGLMKQLGRFVTPRLDPGPPASDERAGGGGCRIKYRHERPSARGRCALLQALRDAAKRVLSALNRRVFLH